MTPTVPSCGGGWKPVGGPSGEWRKVTTISMSNIMHHGRQQPSGCLPPSRRPLDVGIPCPRLAGFAPKISCLSMRPPAPRISGSWGKRRPWPLPGCCRPAPNNLAPHRCSMWCHVRTWEVYGSPDDLQWGWHSGSPPPEAYQRGMWDLPTLEDEAILLGKQIELPQVPGISGVEPAEQITAPRASFPFHPSLRARESWQGIDADPNYPGRLVCFYLKEHDRVPEWWR